MINVKTPVRQATNKKKDSKENRNDPLQEFIANLTPSMAKDNENEISHIRQQLGAETEYLAN